MGEVSAFEILDEKSVKVYFFEQKPKIFGYDSENLERIIKEIKENGNSLYYRMIMSSGIGWFDRSFSRAPSSIEHKLNQAVNKILKLNKN